MLCLAALSLTAVLSGSALSGPECMPDTVRDSVLASCTDWGWVYHKYDTLGHTFDSDFGHYSWFGYYWPGRTAPHEYWHFLLEFDLSGVPDSATVTEATLRFFVDSYQNVGDIGLVPTFHASEEELWYTTDSGPRLHDVFSPHYGWNSLALNATALQAIESRRGQGWVCMSVRWFNQQGRTYIEGGRDTAAPVLRIGFYTVGIRDAGRPQPAERTMLPSLFNCGPIRLSRDQRHELVVFGPDGRSVVNDERLPPGLYFVRGPGWCSKVTVAR